MAISRFDPFKHPRNRRGEFIETLKDELMDEIADIPREDSEVYDTPAGPLEVSRQLKADPDGWEYVVSGPGVYADALTDRAAAELVVEKGVPDTLKSPGVDDLPMGRLTAIEPFTFASPLGNISVGAGDRIDVLRRSGSSFIVRTPDGKSVALLHNDDAPAFYERLPPTPKSPGKRQLSVPEKHQLKIARDTLKMDDAMAKVMGGPSKAEAREIIARLTGKPTPKSPGKDPSGMAPDWDFILQKQKEQGTLNPAGSLEDLARAWTGGDPEAHKEALDAIAAGRAARLKSPGVVDDLDAKIARTEAQIKEIEKGVDATYEPGEKYVRGFRPSDLGDAEEYLADLYVERAERDARRREAQAISDSVKEEAERKRKWAEEDPYWYRPATD